MASQRTKALETLVLVKMQLPAVVEKKEKWYTANCPILDVFSQGETIEKARANLTEALSLFLISCYERGTLDAVLKSCGFRPANKPILKESLDTIDYIDISLPFTVNMDDPQRCRA